MIKSMSLSARKEMLASIRERYKSASWLEKGKILDGFVASTGYDRKYAIGLLNSSDEIVKPKQRRSSRKYNEQVRQALLAIWYAANQICSKRLVPFLPDLIQVMERHGHLRLPDEVRSLLLNISPATVDRILQPEKERVRLDVSTTSPGNLLKNQIKVRTFADWDNVIPGFIEADLVAHCGGNTNGCFLNTLVMVDISSGWLECMPLIRKSASDVIDALRVAEELLPFALLGIDTDCESEFINYDLLDFCEEKKISFTRARTHKKNDQAHVEEKNGSVVRRLVGYDRFEGTKAWEALANLYRVVRKHINFFQPSLKLLEKERKGAKVTKKYDKAKTPYQRILSSDHIDQSKKDELTKEYESLDPVDLLRQLESLQDELWSLAWNNKSKTKVDSSEATNGSSYPPEVDNNQPGTKNRFYHLAEKTDLRKHPRTWRTRQDPFEQVWDEIRVRLELRPELTAKNIIEWLIEKHPKQYTMNQTRTLQRRIAKWRLDQQSQEDRLRELMAASS